jgi:lariat debranching enzyme
MYTDLEKLSPKIDLVICCGDFQSLRDKADMHTMACPPKYRSMGDFYKYYTGELVAPFLTIFVGGNHEATILLR